MLVADFFQALCQSFHEAMTTDRSPVPLVGIAVGRFIEKRSQGLAVKWAMDLHVPCALLGRVLGKESRKAHSCHGALCSANPNGPSTCPSLGSAGQGVSQSKRPLPGWNLPQERRGSPFWLEPPS